jgi:hypothetical protein
MPDDAGAASPEAVAGDRDHDLSPQFLPAIASTTDPTEAETRRVLSAERRFRRRLAARQNARQSPADQSAGD